MILKESIFSNYILNKSPSIGFISTMEWPLVLSLLAAWVLVFICLCRGIKTSGKVRKIEINQTLYMISF
jgi:solute carrier family 6 amino acid transporter-like protein 5/7/9/14